MDDPPTISPPPSLSDAQITTLPASMFYIPNFITLEEEISLLYHINTAPLPTWRQLSHRRLQAHPSPLSPSNTLLDSPLPSWLSTPLIPRLSALKYGHEKGTREIFGDSPHGKPNHCLINEYKPGEGIHMHEDGGAYWPVVCTVSLGSHIVLDLERKRDEEDVEARGEGDRSRGEVKRRGARVLQERRSLLITTGEAYTSFLHGIEGVTVDEGLSEETVANWSLLGSSEEFKEGCKERETRISLTFRDVIKVKRAGKAFGALMNK